MQLIKADNTLPFNHLWLASNSTFMTDHDWFLYLGAVQVWQNLSEHHHYLTSTKSLIRQISANSFPFHSLNIFPFYIWLEGLKRIYYSVISFFSKYHFNTGTLFLLLSSPVFTAIEFDILPGKIVNPRDPLVPPKIELNHPLQRYSENIN